MPFLCHRISKVAVAILLALLPAILHAQEIKQSVSQTGECNYLLPMQMNGYCYAKMQSACNDNDMVLRNERCERCPYTQQRRGNFCVSKDGSFTAQGVGNSLLDANDYDHSLSVDIQHDGSSDLYILNNTYVDTLDKAAPAILHRVSTSLQKDKLINLDNFVYEGAATGGWRTWSRGEQSKLDSYDPYAYYYSASNDSDAEYDGDNLHFLMGTDTDVGSYGDGKLRIGSAVGYTKSDMKAIVPDGAAVVVSVDSSTTRMYRRPSVLQMRAIHKKSGVTIQSTVFSDHTSSPYQIHTDAVSYYTSEDKKEDIGYGGYGYGYGGYGYGGYGGYGGSSQKTYRDGISRNFSFISPYLEWLSSSGRTQIVFSYGRGQNKILEVLDNNVVTITKGNSKVTTAVVTVNQNYVTQDNNTVFVLGDPTTITAVSNNTTFIITVNSSTAFDNSFNNFLLSVTVLSRDSIYYIDTTVTTQTAIIMITGVSVPNDYQAPDFDIPINERINHITVFDSSMIAINLTSDYLIWKSEDGDISLVAHSVNQHNSKGDIYGDRTNDFPGAVKTRGETSFGFRIRHFTSEFTPHIAGNVYYVYGDADVESEPKYDIGGGFNWQLYDGLQFRFLGTLELLESKPLRGILLATMEKRKGGLEILWSFDNLTTFHLSDTWHTALASQLSINHLREMHTFDINSRFNASIKDNRKEYRGEVRFNFK